jgi:tyrosine-protein phosphatase SIW14
MPRPIRNLLGVLIVLVLVVTPVAGAFRFLAMKRNFRPVRDGVLYRSGQMNKRGLERTIYDYGIKTVVSLRDSYDPSLPPPDQEEETICGRLEVRYYRIPPRRWEGAPGMPSPMEPGVQKFIAIMADPRNHPVLIHCFGGIHRAGAFSAIYRMEFERWSNDEAIAELKAKGYTKFDDEWDILGYMQNYVPTWRRQTQSAADDAGGVSPGRELLRLGDR